MLTLIPGGAPSMTRVSAEPIADCGLQRRFDLLEIDEKLPPRIEILLPEVEAFAFASRAREWAAAAGYPPNCNLVDVVRDEERSGWAVVEVQAPRDMVPALSHIFVEGLRPA